MPISTWGILASRVLLYTLTIVFLSGGSIAGTLVNEHDIVVRNGVMMEVRAPPAESRRGSPPR
jgi:hypothetical protein